MTDESPSREPIVEKAFISYEDLLHLYREAVKRGDKAVEDAANFEMDNHALKKRMAALKQRLEYIQSAYCDELDTAKEFADKALAELEGAKE